MFETMTDQKNERNIMHYLHRLMHILQTQVRVEFDLWRGA